MKNWWIVFKSGDFLEVENCWCLLKEDREVVMKLDVVISKDSLIDLNKLDNLDFYVNGSDYMITDLKQIIILNFSTFSRISKDTIRISSISHRVEDYVRELDKDSIMWNRITELKRLKKLNSL